MSAESQTSRNRLQYTTSRRTKPLSSNTIVQIVSTKNYRATFGEAVGVSMSDMTELISTKPLSLYGDEKQLPKNCKGYCCTEVNLIG